MLGFLLALAAAFGGSPRPEPAPFIPAEYRCEADWQTPDDRFVARASLSADGHPQSYHLTWLRISPNRALAGWVTQFDFEGARLPAPGEDWGLLLRLDGFAPGTHRVRVDLLRRGEDGVESVALSSPRILATPYIFSRWSRNAIRAALAGAAAFNVRVTDRRGRTRLSHLIPSAVLDGPEAALAARRAALEALVADYRTRCQFIPEGSEIVVT